MGISRSGNDCVWMNITKGEAGEKCRENGFWHRLDGTEGSEEETEEVDRRKRGENIRCR